MSQANPDHLPKTLGELTASSYQAKTVKEEIRANLITKLQNAEPLFPDIVGYDDTVIPQIVNAILGLQDIIFLGERGQAKSRIARSLTNLLDEWTPTVAGSEIPENPLNPITPATKALLSEGGDATDIAWIHRDDRYGEKLATPDITLNNITMNDI